jgi:flagellar biogenesis protein FliO
MSGRAVLEQGGANKFFYFFILEAILLGIFLVYLMKKMGGKRSHASSFSIEFKNSKKRKKNDS